MAETIKSMFIFEIMGRPPEHIKQVMEEFIDKLSEIQGIKIISRKVHEPKLIQNEKVTDIFTTFAEVEMSLVSINLVFDVVLNMLPAHIEIIEPEDIRIKNVELSSSLSNLAVKLHRYDEVAKAALIHEDRFKKKIEELQAKIDKLEGKEKIIEDSKDLDNKEEKKTKKNKKKN